MPGTTADPNDEFGAILAGIGDDDEHRLELQGTLSRPTSGVTIYPHAYSVRISIAQLRAEEVLPKSGWSSSTSSSSWLTYSPRGCNRRVVLRGSAWLTGRAPNNRKLPLARSNREWRTKFYSIAIDHGDDGYHVDLQGVRYRDVRRFAEEVLGLEPSEYNVDYWRTVERYIVLNAPDAHRFGAALGSSPSRGSGRLARKLYLLRDHPIPIAIRRRTPETALLSIYRIAGGATAAYRCEIRLSCKRQNRHTFNEADIEKLDAILLDFVNTYQLAPMCKPARWEPRSFVTAVERGEFDTNMQQVGHRAWRGTQVSAAMRARFRNLHTAVGVNLVDHVVETGFPGQARSIRTATPRTQPTTRTPTSTRSPTWSCVQGTGFEPRRYVKSNHDQPEPETEAKTPYEAICHEIAKLPGSLVEVILDPDQDPEPLVAALEQTFPSIGVTALAAVEQSGHVDTWGSVVRRIGNHPATDDSDVVVVVVDTSTVVGVVDAVVECDADTGSTEQGPFVPSAWRWDLTPWVVRAMAAWFSQLMADLRIQCEQTGLTVIVITVDARPHHGSGPLLPTHRFRDGRVRSWLGDAARYSCHQRYLVEQTVKTTFKRGYTTVVEDGDETIIEEHHEHIEQESVVGRVIVIKDEAEGLVGRVLAS